MSDFVYLEIIIHTLFHSFIYSELVNPNHLNQSITLSSHLKPLNLTQPIPSQPLIPRKPQKTPLSPPLFQKK